MLNRRNRPADADDLLIKIVAALLLLAAGVWIYLQNTRSGENPGVAAPIQAAALQANVQAREQRLAFEAAQRQAYEDQLRAAQSQAEASTLNGKLIYNCSYAGTTTMQTEPCKAPSMDAGVNAPPDSYSNQDSLQQQERVRQEAEARLRVEQAKLAAITGSGTADPVYYTSQTSDLDRRRARCQAQKNYRDDVLRQVGLNRTFDLLRQLDEQVYEACKGT